MNIFLFDKDMHKNVEMYCDSHVVKMILEYAQMLSTAVRESGIDEGYKATHKNHPCTLWTKESLSNWRYLKATATFLHEEWQWRFNHPMTEHKSFTVIKNLPEPNIENIGVTEFAQAMPDRYKNEDVFQAYRDYFNGEKRHIARWRNREMPEWFNL